MVVKPITQHWMAIGLALFAGLANRAVAQEDRTMDGATVTAAPSEEKLFAGYRLRINGAEVPVYACRVSAMPFNQVWPGYQRPLDQSELAGFAYWDMTAPVRVEIDCPAAPKTVAIRPSHLGITPEVKGQQITFSLAKPSQLVVEIDGPHGALHLFANPPEKDAPAPDAPNVRYFGPGVHNPGRIQLASGQSVYIAAGAVVYGAIHAEGSDNIRVSGRGVLDQSPFERGKGGGAIRLTDCSNVTIEGIIMRDPDVWCCSLFGCHDVTIRNVKLVGLWRYNADGIDVCNSQRVTVEDSFVRAFDDALVVKGLRNRGDKPVEHVTFRRCVVWCDWGRGMEIGAETCAPEISDVAFLDSDIVRTTHIAMDIQHGDRAMVRDIRFENIRVEMPEPNPHPAMQNGKDDRYQPRDGYLPALAVIVIRGTNYSADKVRGQVRNVVFRDISIQADRMPHSSFRGFDGEHTVDGVTLSGWQLNGKPLPTLKAMRVGVAEHVKNVTVE
jgi:hypothetical protein